jgi:hypothetical protein
MAPNVTGWSSSLQEFLSLRGYLLGEKVRGTVGTVNSNGELDSLRTQSGGALEMCCIGIKL